jgi:hypothetical protein
VQGTDYRKPIALTGTLSQLKSGRRSAPRLPQVLQVKRGSISDSLTSSGHASPLIAIEWLGD